MRKYEKKTRGKVRQWVFRQIENNRTSGAIMNELSEIARSPREIEVKNHEK